MKNTLETKINPKNQVRMAKLLAMFYGLLAIGLSYVVGNLGTVIQVSITIASSLNGPLLALFTIAIFFRFVNAKGAMTGFVIGVVVTLSISMGSIIFPRPQIALPTTYDHCPNDIFQQFVAGMTEKPINRFIPYYENPQ